MQDLKNNLRTTSAVDIQAIGSDTTTVGNIIDRMAQTPDHFGFEALLFVLLAGSLTDGDYQLIVEHGDDPGLSDAAVVPLADLLGDVDAITLTDDNDMTVALGYVGEKQYVRASIVSTNVTTGGTLGAAAVLGMPRHRDEPV